MTIDDFLQCQEDGISGTSNVFVSPENRGSTNNLLQMLFRVAAHHSSTGERRYLDFNSYYHLNVFLVGQLVMASNICHGSITRT